MLDLTVVFWGLLIVAQAVVAAQQTRRLRAPSAAILVMWYVTALQATFLWSLTGDFDIALGGSALYSQYYVFNDVQVAYSAIFICAAAATVGLMPPRSSFVATLRGALHRRSAHVLLWAGALAMFAVVFANAVTLNLNAVWRNTEYLLLTSTDAYLVSVGVAMTLKTALGIAAISLSFLLPMALRRRLALCGAFLFAQWAVAFAFYAGAHSRLSSVMVATLFAAAGVVFGKKARLPLAISGLGAVLLVTLMALAGRGDPYQGVQTIPDTAWRVLTDTGGEEIRFALANLMQGIFVTGDALMLEAQHPESYKALSFSPFPSVIDGFDELLYCCEVRVNQYVPMSAVAEVVAFGPFYWTVALTFLFLLLRKSAVALQDQAGPLALGLNAFAALYFVVANAYPVRNSFRQLLLVLILFCFVPLASKLKGKRSFWLESGLAMP